MEIIINDDFWRADIFGKTTKKCRITDSNRQKLRFFLELRVVKTTTTLKKIIITVLNSSLPIKTNPEITKQWQSDFDFFCSGKHNFERTKSQLQ